MLVKTLSRDEAKELFDLYASNNEIPERIYDKLDSDYLEIRKDLLGIEKKTRNKETCEQRWW